MLMVMIIKKENTFHWRAITKPAVSDIWNYDYRPERTINIKVGVILAGFIRNFQNSST